MNNLNQEPFKFFAQGNVIYIIFKKINLQDPNQAVKDAQFYNQKISEILNENRTQDFSVLNDINNLKGDMQIPGPARKIYMEALKKSQIQKVAIVSKGFENISESQFKMMNTMITSLATMFGYRLKLCSSTNEALHWIRKN